jgi:hypothetical protein
MKILNSYKIRTGIDTITWLATSGGVITAEIMKIITIANLRYVFRISGVTNPMRVKK